MHPGRLAELDLICIAPLLSQPEMNAESLEFFFFFKESFLSSPPSFSVCKKCSSRLISKDNCLTSLTSL